MTTEFFSKLGQELVGLKNSPFYRLGQRPSDLRKESNLLRTQLSYDPNRLFNAQKFQESKKAMGDPEMVEAMREEEREAQKVEFQMLKKTTLEEFERRIENMQKEIERGNTHLFPSIFKTARTVCLGCNRCSIFRGNFKNSHRISREGGRKVDFLSCINCGCAMGAHAPAKPLPHHRSSIWKHIKTTELNFNGLNFSGLILAFRVKNGIANQQLLWKLGQLLERMGFSIEDQSLVEKQAFQLKLLRCELLGSSQDPGLLEGMLQLADCIYRTGGWRQEMKVGEQFKDSLTILKKVVMTVRSRSLQQVNEDDSIAVLLVRHNDQSPSPVQLKLGLGEVKEHLSGVSIVHVSATSQNAIFEVQELFPAYFRLHRRLFLLPQSDQPQQSGWKFEDMLDYNGYRSFVEGIKDIQRNNLEQILTFLPYHQLTYLLGKQLASNRISHFGLYYSTKVGPQSLTFSGPLPPFLEVTDQEQCQKVVSAFLPSYLLGQRCVIVIRPFAAKQSQIIANTLRINGFVIIQRKKLRISLDQAYLLAALEHITEEQKNQYTEMMTLGVTELMLVSKRGALFEAQTLLNPNPKGLSEANTCWMTENPSFEIKRGHELFSQELEMHLPEHKEIFRSGGDLVSIQRCLLGTRGHRRVMQNCSTGELMVVESSRKSKGNFKGTSRQRQAVLQGLREDNFNYMLFSSKSDKTTEELASIFFPQSTQFDSAIVLVKPAYYHMLERLKEVLGEYRYHIIFHKSITFSKLLAYELLVPLQKINAGGESFDQVLEAFVGNRVSLLCLSKIGAVKELLALLSSFSFLPARTTVDLAEGDILVRESLIPVWTNQQSFLKLFSRHLSSLQQAVQLVTHEGHSNIKAGEKMELYEYFIGSLLGVRPSDPDLNSPLGRLALYSTSEHLAAYQSWYYASMSQIASNHVPLLFQYRTYQEETLVLQTHPGEPFMSVIITHYLNQVQMHKGSEERAAFEGRKNKRESLVLLIWAKKLLQLVEALSGLNNQTVPAIQISGWGNLTFKNNQHCGQYSAEEAMKEEKTFLGAMLVKYKEDKNISHYIQKLLESRIFSERYSKQQRRLLPSRGQLEWEDCLRVVETGSVGRLFLQGEFQTLDPDNQKELLGHSELLSLRLFRVEPFIGPKYRLLAEMLVFFERWKEEALEYRQLFGEILAHLKGLLLKYQDVELLEFEVYLQILKMVHRQELSLEQLRVYPSLRKNKLKTVLLGEESVGKTRKYIEQQHYFKPFIGRPASEIQLGQKYGHFNLKTLEEPLAHHVLNKEDDPLHRQWNTQQHFVNMLRDQSGGSQPNRQEGLFVQYQRKLNEQEESVREKMQMQIKRLQGRTENGVLRDNGLDPQIYYKRVKGGSHKLEDAIKKQLQRLEQEKGKSANL